MRGSGSLKLRLYQEFELSKNIDFWGALVFLDCGGRFTITYPHWSHTGTVTNSFKEVRFEGPLLASLNDQPFGQAVRSAGTLS